MFVRSQKCHLFMTWKPQGHLAFRTKFCRTPQHNTGHSTTATVITSITQTLLQWVPTTIPISIHLELWNCVCQQMFAMLGYATLVCVCVCVSCVRNVTAAYPKHVFPFHSDSLHPSIFVKCFKNCCRKQRKTSVIIAIVRVWKGNILPSKVILS
jgi:hypothetical protein